MSETDRRRREPHRPVGLLSFLVLIAVGGSASAEPPAVVDSQSIVRILRPAPPTTPATRSLIVAPRTEAGGRHDSHKVSLDIRFAHDSDRLSDAAHAQLTELGAALNSSELAQRRFLIAGHTSASGAPQYNQRLSEARARAVRNYLMQRFSIAPQRLETAGFGSSQPLPGVPPSAEQQRRVEISTLPPT
jgi:outer membrane protein OmpA-like peptidoglycan-associated protein